MGANAGIKNCRRVCKTAETIPPTRKNKGCGRRMRVSLVQSWACSEVNPLNHQLTNCGVNTSPTAITNVNTTAMMLMITEKASWASASRFSEMYLVKSEMKVM